MMFKLSLAACCILIVFVNFVQGQADERPSIGEMRRSARTNEFIIRQLSSLLKEGSKIEKELDILDYQREKLLAAWRQYRSRQREIAKEIDRQKQMSESQDESRERSVANVELELTYAAMKELVSGAAEVLLPRQLERLKQIAIQYELSHAGGDGFRIVLPLRDKLRLPSAKAKELVEVVEKANIEYREELRKLRERLDRSVIDSLSPDAQKKIEELIGEFHYFEGVASGR